ncbi:MAG: aldo/keto reductase [Anaerolineaceae bacterium]|nr:aldo/keto reductase [Anaerolineaceae bacterium]
MNEAAPAKENILAGIEMGVGVWAWGERLIWGYGRDYSLGDLRGAFESSIAAGIRLFDTAEIYGQGQSEQILGQFLKQAQEPVLVATKFMPFPWRLSRQSLMGALKSSLKRLGLEQVDLYQIHQPLPPVNIETWMEGLTEAVNAGLTRAVGVSNYDRRQMQRASDRLQREGVHLASNQVEYHLLNRKVEKNGLLRQCQEQETALIAYSPLAMGVLTGKYSPENLPQGVRSGRFGRKYLEKVQPLLTLLKRIGAEHGSKTPSQVALNWVMCKGALPIPGAKTLLQAEQNAGASGWRLSDEAVMQLDEMSDRVCSDL